MFSSRAAQRYEISIFDQEFMMPANIDSLQDGSCRAVFQFHILAPGIQRPSDLFNGLR